MILLMGGTSETASMAEALAEKGYDVLVSSATDVPLFVGASKRITHRSGRLPEADMIALIREKNINAIVDVTHPYAAHVRATSERVAGSLGISYLTVVRPSTVSEQEGVRMVANHADAARLACETGGPILLTTGSKDVKVYADEAHRAGLPVIARVLSHPDSLKACRDAGIPDDRIVTGRGPFSVDENRRLIRQFGVRVLVTKDSGEAGGVCEKLEAARLEKCCVIVVGRPSLSSQHAFDNREALVQALTMQINGSRSK